MSHPNTKPRAVLRGPSPTLSGPPRYDEGLPFKTLLSMAAVQFSTGGLFLALAWRDAATLSLCGWAGALLLATAVVQGKLVLKSLKQQRNVRPNVFRRGVFWKSLFVGIGLCYAGSLMLGPDPSTPCLFVSAISVWYTLLLLPIAANPQILETWKRISQRKIPRRSAAFVYHALLLAVTAELSLRAYDWTTRNEWLTGMIPRSSMVSVASAGVAGGGGAPVSLDSDSRFHVAIVGDEVTLGGIHNDGALSQLEVLVPGVRVTNFSMPQAGPREYASELTDRVLKCQPNLVLTFVSVGEDILSESAGTELFDWRSLELSQLPLARQLVGARPTTTLVPSDPAMFLQLLGRELTVCHTPIDSTTDRRWKKTFRHLDGLVRECQRSQVELALVVVPGQFQVNQVLCETLCRRMGYEQKQIDLDLPQRKLASFAGDRQVPYVDLLPHLRLCQEPPYERTTRQWNSAGAAVAVRTIGGWLQARYAAVIPATGQVSRQ